VALASGRAEVLLGLAGSVGSQKKRVGASGGLHDQLVKGQALAASLSDSGAGGFGETECSDIDLG